jgi:hypothetical protein
MIGASVISVEVVKEALEGVLEVDVGAFDEGRLF